MSHELRYEVHDNKGSLIGRCADQAAALLFAADHSRSSNQGYFTLWWINDFGCPIDLIGHASSGRFHARPCGGAR